MGIISLSKQQARRLMLTQQGLFPPRSSSGKEGILEYIRRAGCIQFDPLNIAGYNQELVLQARISGFRQEMLRSLLYEDRLLLDGWDKNMSIYRTEDWPYFRRRREAFAARYGGSGQPAAAILPQVRQALKERGPLSSIDLDYDEAVDWAWAPARIARAALESMYFWGELVIHHKINTRRIFDFAANALPAELLAAPDPNVTEEQYQDWYVLRRIGGVGLLWGKSGDAWLGTPAVKSGERNAAIKRLLSQGSIVEVQVEDIPVPLYMKREALQDLEKTQDGSCSEPRAAVIAPLDNLLWDRKLIQELFGFEYRWEVYKPAAERQYGYYVLPVLYGDRFIARFEPGFDKKSRHLTVKNWWWEPGMERTEALQAELIEGFKGFLGYLRADRLVIDKKTARKADLGWLKALT